MNRSPNWLGLLGIAALVAAGTLAWSFELRPRLEVDGAVEKRTMRS